jgi:hypothetical protein
LEGEDRDGCSTTITPREATESCSRPLSRAFGQPFESVWSRAQSVIRHDYRDVVGTPSGEGQVDQFLALLSCAAPRRQSLGDLTLGDEVSETIRGQKQAIA